MGLAVAMLLSTYWTAKLLNNYPISSYLQFSQSDDVKFENGQFVLPQRRR